MGDKLKKMHIQFIHGPNLGDGKHNDTMSNRVGAKRGAKRISRACHTPFAEADRVMKECAYVLQEVVLDDFVIATSTLDDLTERNHELYPTLIAAKAAIKDAKARLKAIGLQPVYNTLLILEFDYCGDPRGLWGMTPTDLMHAFQLGILKYFVKIAIDPLSNELKARLDRLVDELLGQHQCALCGEYPRYNFSKGYSKLTQLTSDEWDGMLFVLLMVL